MYNQPSKLRNISLLAATVVLVAVGAWAAPAASARTPASQVQISMRFAFNRNAPAAITYAELTKAAWRTCRWEAGPIPGSRRSLAPCVSSLIDDGVAKIDVPDLATLHALSSGKPLPAFADAGQAG